MLAWLEARLTEPSTYAGIAGIVGSMTFLPHAAEVSQLLPVMGAALMSVFAIVLPESKK